MADEQQRQNPFTRPGFVTAAVVVGLIAVLAAVIGALGGGRDSRASSPPVASPATSPPPASATSSDGPSVCGLPGEVLSGTLPAAPAADWAYQGTIAYPTSDEYGPAKTSPAGFRYCYQHSPEGALFAAANAMVQAESGATTTRAWWRYFVSTRAPNRSQFINQPYGTRPTGVRTGVAGFRLLEYDGRTARVDLGVRADGSGNTAYGSGIYTLVWEGGDWKLLPSPGPDPLQVAQLPDLAGYVTWGLAYG